MHGVDAAGVWFAHHTPSPTPQVSRNFTEIFEELAPGGTGRLEMKLREMAAVSPPQDTLTHCAMSIPLVHPCRILRAAPVGPHGWRTLLTHTKAWPYRWAMTPPTNIHMLCAVTG